MKAITHSIPWADIKPAGQIVKIEIFVPVEDIDFSSCTNTPDSIATDWGDEPANDCDLSLASYEGRFIESFGSYENEVIDFYLENIWGQG